MRPLPAGAPGGASWAGRGATSLKNSNRRRAPLYPRLNLSGRLRSLRCAGRGLGRLLGTQPNARLHAAATALVIGAGWAGHLAAGEWCAVVLALVAVWVAEALNTALEFLADAIHPAFHPLVGQAKDVAAGAVLLAALGALVIGLLLFGVRAPPSPPPQPNSSPFQPQWVAATSVKVM